MNFYRRKLLNALLYFIKKRSKPTTITVVAKLLFLLDFEHFKETGMPAIGLRYYAYPKGPLPLKFWHEFNNDKVPSDFNEHLRLTITRDEIDPSKRTIKFQALSKPDMSVFTPREKRILERLAEIYRDTTAQIMIKASHERGGPWSETKRVKGEKKEIDYLLALNKNSFISEEEATESLNNFFASLENFNLSPS